MMGIMRLGFFIGILVSCVSLSWGASLGLSWTPPTTNEDGTVLTDLARYNVYHGTSSGNYSQITSVGNVTSYEVTNLAAGTVYYFVVTAYDTSGNESGYSNEVGKQAGRPGAFLMRQK